MAYAAITKTLINEVESKIRNMRAAEINSMGHANNVLEYIAADPVFRSQMIDLLWEPERDLRARLQQYNKKATVMVTATNVRENGLEQIAQVQFQADDVPVIAKFSGYAQDRVLMTVGAAAHPRLPEAFDLMVNHTEANNRWNAVNEQVVSFLNNCKSANEAMKLWPDVARYFPKETIDKVNQKTEKAVRGESNALEALKALDFDSINTSTVLARMAGAQV